MQFSADFVAFGMHQADVLHAEREIGLRMSAEERDADDAGPSPEHVVRRRGRVHHRAPRRVARLAPR
jgi:hypothetical protein